MLPQLTARLVDLNHKIAGTELTSAKLAGLPVTKDRERLLAMNAHLLDYLHEARLGILVEMARLDAT